MRSSDRDTDIAEAFVLLADSLRVGHDVIDTMDILVQVSTQFTSATDAGILLADSKGVLHVVASSNERASDVEEAQLGFDQGPCLDSFHSGEAVEIADLTDASTPWPEFAGIARMRGYKAAHASPLHLRGQMLGAMGLFSSDSGLLSDQDTALAQAFAQVATISVVHQRTMQNHATLNAQLQHALDSRVLIEQAKGFLAQRHDIRVDEAFTLLRTHARGNSLRLRDVASDVVTRVITL